MISRSWPSVRCGAEAGSRSGALYEAVDPYPCVSLKRAVPCLSSDEWSRSANDLPIPDDEADNYNDAIEDGRCVVAYKLNGDKDAAIAGFHAAGLSVVRTY